MARRSAKRIVLDRLANAYADVLMCGYEWREAKKEHPIYSDTVREAESKWFQSGAICNELGDLATELGASYEEYEKAHEDGNTLFVARLAGVIAEKEV